MSIKSLFVDYKSDSSINKIECSGIQPRNSSIEEMEIYNPNVAEPMHKFWYIIDNAKLDRKLNRGAQAKIVLPSSNKQLIESIKNLDTKLNELIKAIIKQCERESYENNKMNSLIEIKDYYPPNMILSVVPSTYVTNSRGESLDLMRIKNGSNIKLIVELDRVIFRRKEIQKIWKIKQIKKINKPTLFGDIFSQLESDVDRSNFAQSPPIKRSISIVPPPPPAPHYNTVPPSHPPSNRRPNSTNKNDIDPKEEVRGFRPPTANELKSMIGKLKPRTNDEQSKSPNLSKSDNSSMPANFDNFESEAESESEEESEFESESESIEEPSQDNLTVESEESEDSEDSYDPLQPKKSKSAKSVKSAKSAKSVKKSKPKSRRKTKSKSVSSVSSNKSKKKDKKSH